MKKNKDKRLKKLRKIHVLPHIILLTIFISFFAGAMVIYTEMFFLFLVESQIEDAYQEAQMFTTLLEEQLDEDDRNIEDIMNVLPIQDFGIYDNVNQEFVIPPEREIDLSHCFSYELNQIKVYVSLNGGNLFSSYGKKQDGIMTAIVSDFVGNANTNRFVPLNTINADFLSYQAWMNYPLKDGEKSVYYCFDVKLKVKEAGYLLISLLMAGLLVAVPLLLYVITLCMSILGQRRSAKLLFYDAITGGKNWLHFRDRVESLLKKNKRGKRHYVIVSLRMDRYQSYCACFGALEGEKAINLMNAVLGGAVDKKREVFARYSEAEFGLFLLMDSREQVTERVEFIRNKMVEILEPRKIDFKMGFCEVMSGDQVDELYSNASIARKNVPVNSIEKNFWFDESLKEEQLWEHYVEENMERALSEGELHVYLQPKYNAETHRLGGAEALIRWISAEKGFIGPGKFIPIFEKNGFITKIDDFMLSSVAKLQAQWVQEGRNVVPVSVNISRAHFTQEDLAEHICEIVEAAGAPKNLIELELTESAFFEDKDILIGTVEKLKSMGFSVSMDDFGAGYSSLNSLKDLRLDVLKIDADFFRGREENEERGSLIVSETIQLAKSLGMTTVAEGIESADQVEFLAKSGCDLIQGFYFAKPMPVADYEKKMEEDRENKTV